MPIPYAEELLRELVRRPSINPMGRTDLPPDLIHESRVTDYLESQLQLLGVRYERHEVQPGRANLVAFYTPPDARGCVLWEAHQDTVPVDGMTIDPFAGEVREGRLYGRGACDVKGGGVAMLSAFAQLVALNKPGTMSVILAFTIDEEHTFLGAQHLVSLGLKPDFAIVAEPTGLNIVNAHKGVVRWAIETHGVAVHSSRPEQGVSAIYRMTPILAALETYATELRTRTAHPQLGTPSLCIGMIDGGVSPNTVPDLCHIEIDRRLNPGETATSAMAEVQKYLEARVSTPFVMLPAAFACSPLTGELSATLVAKLGIAIDGVVGSHTVDAVPYGTDASTIAEAGIPVVVFGPGSIEQAHTKDEYLELAELDKAIQILVRFAQTP